LPKMIAKSDKDAIAKRRTIMILDVLSGRTPVTDAIARAEISRQTYYQLEMKALVGMLDALTPGETKRGPSPKAHKALEEAEQKIERLEQDKRRLERLLSMTTRVLEGPLKMAAGRKRKPKSSKPSSKPSSATTKTKPSPNSNRATPPEPSTPTASGEAGR